MVSKEWGNALLKNNYLAGIGDAGDVIIDSGGQPFINRLAELVFELFQLNIKSISTLCEQ